MRPNGLGGPSGRWVYSGSWKRALLIGVCLSWVASNVIALIIEHRTNMLLNPWNQYKAFYFGDSLCLPAVVLAIWYLGWHMPLGSNLSHKRWWHLLCFGGGLAFGITFHFWEASTHFYAYGKDNSPTKLYHDFVVLPLYSYAIFSAGLPAVWRSKGGRKPRLMLFGAAAVFFGLNVWDNFPKPSGGYVSYSWTEHMHFLLQYFS